MPKAPLTPAALKEARLAGRMLAGRLADALAAVADALGETLRGAVVGGPEPALRPVPVRVPRARGRGAR